MDRITWYLVGCASYPLKLVEVCESWPGHQKKSTTNKLENLFRISVILSCLAEKFWFFSKGFISDDCFAAQRDTIQAASSFAQRNKLPVRLEEQMIAHLRLRHRTDSEGLQQQETLETLPKAIRSGISHYLFYPLVDKVYLFHGVSNDLLFQLVIPSCV